MDKPFYKRVLLKLSGEALMGEQEFGISSDVINSYARQIKEIVELGVEVSIVTRRSTTTNASARASVTRRLNSSASSARILPIVFLCIRAKRFAR